MLTICTNKLQHCRPHRVQAIEEEKRHTCCTHTMDPIIYQSMRHFDLICRSWVNTEYYCTIYSVVCIILSTVNCNTRVSATFTLKNPKATHLTQSNTGKKINWWKKQCEKHDNNFQSQIKGSHWTAAHENLVNTTKSNPKLHIVSFVQLLSLDFHPFK